VLFFLGHLDLRSRIASTCRSTHVENELLVSDLEAAEIVLLVRIVVRREIVERSCELNRRALTSSGRALTAAVSMTRPPVNDSRKRSLSVRILALLTPWIASCSSGFDLASQVGHRSLQRQSHSSHQSVPQGQVWCFRNTASVSSSFRRGREGMGDFGIAFLPAATGSGSSADDGAVRDCGCATSGGRGLRSPRHSGCDAFRLRLVRGMGRALEGVLTVHFLGGERIADLFRESTVQRAGLGAFFELPDRTVRPHVVRHIGVGPFGIASSQ